MGPFSESPASVRFGVYELRPRSRELYKLGMKLKLRPQPFQVLHVLVDHPADVVTRDQLRQQLWPSDTFVDFEHSLNTAIKELRAVLDDSATEPRYIETIPKLGYRFIFPVETSLLAIQQVPVVEQIPAPLQPQAEAPKPTPPPTATDHRDTERRRTWLPLVAAALLIVGLAQIVVRLGVFHRSANSAASAALKPRPSIAVLGFKNLSSEPDKDWMSTAITEMLGAELASGQQIRVIPSENVARMRHDLTLVPSDTFGQETLGKMHSQLGTDMVASGSFLALPNGSNTKLHIVLQVQDTRTGETVAAITEDGTEADLPQLISAGGDNLRHTLGIGSLSASAAKEVRASIPANSEAERLYAEGLAKLQSFDSLSARTLFEKALAADPSHALSHSALAESLAQLGYDSIARDEAKKTLDLSSNLSREDRLSIEGRYRDLSRDRPATIDIYRTLHNFFPDNLEYGLLLARNQIRANRSSDAFETIAALRKLPAPIGTDARLGFAEASPSERLGDMQRSQKAAAAGIARAKELGSGLLMASGLTSESWAWSNLGEFDKAIDDETQARELYSVAGNAHEAAVAMLGVGMFRQSKGDFAEARKSYELALAEFKRSGAQWNIASCSNHLGLLSQETGDLDQAGFYFQEALKIQRSLNDKRGVASDLDNLSSVEMSLGKLAAAQEMKQEALQDFHEIGDKHGESITLLNLGELLYQRGNLAAAKEKYQQAIAMNREISHKTGLAYSLVGLAEVQTAQDQLNDAFSSTEESMNIRQQTKEEVRLAEGDVQLAVIALEQGKPAEAEAIARKAVTIFEQHKSAGSAAIANSILARSLVAEGKLADAGTTASRAASLAQQGTDHMVRMQTALANAEVDIQSGKAADAVRHLDVLRQQSSREGYAVYELEARLLQAKAELKSGNTNLARANLEKLQSDARTRGFLLVARKAAAHQQ
jgi:eukaryotic-like serine/threonine-protein kinase